VDTPRGSARIAIRLNGAQHEFAAGDTIAVLVISLGFSAEQVAVERNSRLVPRTEHGNVALEEGDAIEVVTLVGGG
jgi:sulfur carrier protein